MSIFPGKPKFNIARFQVITILLFFLVFGWFLFTYRILDVPPGINGDEAAIGLNAALVARSGFDSNGKFLPLFTAAAGSNDWKQPVSFYSTVLSFRLFGVSYFMLRAVSVFFVLLSGILIFFLIFELANLKTAIWGLLIFATTPIVIIQSHLALENIAPVPFITFWLWMIVKYSKETKLKYLILAGVSLGLGIYSYLGLRLIAPPLTAASVIFVYYLSRKKPKEATSQIIIFLLVMVPFWIIFLLLKNQYPGSFLGQYRPHTISSYQQLLLPYISSFDPSFLFIKGDVTPYHSTGKQGMFLLASLLLFILGLVKILQKRQPILLFILSTFFLVPVLYGLTSDIHRSSRLLSLIPFYVVTVSLGMGTLFDIRSKWRFICIAILVLLISLNFTDFLRDYWFEYPNRVKAEFSRPYHLVFQKAKQLAQENNLTVFIQNDFRMQNPIAIDFFEAVYFPNKLSTWEIGQSLPQSSLIIVDSSAISSKAEQVVVDRIEGTDYALLINEK